MIARFELQRQEGRFRLRRFTLLPVSVSGSTSTRSGRAYQIGIGLIGLLTVWFLIWLVYRWVVQPTWLANLSQLPAEMIALVETAAAFTLAVLWGGLGWRHWYQLRRFAQSSQTSALDIEKLQSLSPKAFERYVAGLFRQKGYTVQVRGRSGDLGVDLEVMSFSGRHAIVQCKRYQNTIGPEIVRELYGTLMHERVAWAFLVTTADISDAAREWAQDKPITLIDGETLVQIAASLRQKMRR